MPTLRDVARQAGVSVATASRVAAGAPGVRPATRERVELAMRELLYVTAAPASSGIVGLLVPELDNPIFPALAQAMEQRGGPRPATRRSSATPRARRSARRSTSTCWSSGGSTG